MMRKLYVITLMWGLLGLLTLPSCIDDLVVREFENFTLGQTDYGIYSNSKSLFVYDEECHQLAFNSQQRLFRIQTDDMSTYVQMTLDAAPLQGEVCGLKLEYKGLSGLNKNYAVKVLKVDSTRGIVWLSEATSLTSFIMHYE